MMADMEPSQFFELSGSAPKDVDLVAFQFGVFLAGRQNDHPASGIDLPGQLIPLSRG